MNNRDRPFLEGKGRAGVGPGEGGGWGVGGLCHVEAGGEIWSREV